MLKRHTTNYRIMKYKDTYRPNISIMLFITITLFLCTIFNSCNSKLYNKINEKLTERHSEKNIKIKGLNDSLSISYENDSAKIEIGLLETLHSLEKVKAKGRLDPRFDGEKIANLNKAMNLLSKSVSNVVIVDYSKSANQINPSFFDIWAAIDSDILREILLNGNVQIYNKRESRFETKVFMTHEKYIMVGELHEYYYFKFQNGSIFHIQIIYV